MQAMVFHYGLIRASFLGLEIYEFNHYVTEYQFAFQAVLSVLLIIPWLEPMVPTLSLGLGWISA